METTTGQKINALRTERNISIEQIATLTDLSADQISAIESDTMEASMAILVRIARTLGTRLGTLLDGREEAVPTLWTGGEPAPSVSISHGNQQAWEHLDVFPMGNRKLDRNMEPMMVYVKYTEDEVKSRVQHEGEEFLYVIEGSIELRYGQEEYTLHAGDSIYFDSIVPHAYSTLQPGDQAQVITVIYTPF